MKSWKNLLVAAACCSLILAITIVAEGIHRANEAKRAVSEACAATVDALQVFEVIDDGIKTKIAIMDATSNALDKFDEPWISPNTAESIGKSILEGMDEFNKQQKNK